MVRIAVFLGNEEIFLLLFELMISQVFKPFGTLQCWKFSLNSANSAAVFSYLFVLLARSSPLEPRIHDQGLLVPGLSENTNTVYCSWVGSWEGDFQLLSTFLNQCQGPQVRQQLLSRQRSKKNFYDRGTRPLPEMHQGEAVRIQQGREWKLAVVVKQQVAPRSSTVATPDGTQMRRNRVHLQQTKEAAQVVSPDLEPVSNQSDVQLCEPPLGRSQRVRRVPQRPIETSVASLLS